MHAAVSGGPAAAVARPLRPFAQFRTRDHLGDPGASIRANVDGYLAGHGIDLAGGQVLMLANARVLGRVFNPLTVYWCHRADGTLAAVVAEVHNTYGERHCYLLDPDARGRAQADKDFYVSPFLPVAGRYRMRLPEPAGTLRLAVSLDIDGQPVFAATVRGLRSPYTTWRLISHVVRYPWVTAQVSAGARVTTLTISRAQCAKARARIAAAGLTDRVDVQLLDYRQATGSYDVILSVEMIEAVGEPYWPAYFATLDRLLAPGGRVGLQAITMPHDRMLATLSGHTWIHKYIFPGGQVPSLEAILATLREHTGLRISADFPLGHHYARTLHEWRTRFLAAADDVGRLGFDSVFRRMWNLYLAYSEAGVRSGYLDVHQLLLQRPS